MAPHIPIPESSRREQRRQTAHARRWAFGVVVAGVWLGLLALPGMGRLVGGALLGLGAVLAGFGLLMGLGWLGFGLFALGDRLAGWARRRATWPAGDGSAG